jgi:decaprenylphospho-beta-D-erythro-pentofuranosid-2-ulose 2-reductase
VIDALGAPQSLLLLGGTSDIALATARRLVARRTRRVVLAARPSERLDAAADELRGLGAQVEVVPFDADDTESHAAAVDKAFAGGDVDVTLLAFGVLGDQAQAEADPAHAVAVARTNYLGAVSAALHVTQRMKAQGHGTLVVLSSIAGERVRKTNFVYGSTKAGLDGFAQGLADSLHGTGVHVMVVRPGFVRSRMTEGREPAPFATTPEAVADAIERGLQKRAQTVWVPGVLRVVGSAFRHAPRAVFRRLPG